MPCILFQMKIVIIIIPSTQDRGAEAVGQKRRSPVIKLRSTAGTGYTYVTRKNRRNNPDRLTLRKYDPIIRRHVVFREDR